MPHLLLFLLLIVWGTFQTDLFAAQTSSGFAPPVFQRSLGVQTFGTDLEGWVAEARAKLKLFNQTLTVEAAPHDPTFYHLFDIPCAQLRLRMKVKTRDEAVCEIFWLTQEIPQRDPRHSVKLNLPPDKLWHEHDLILPVTGNLTCLLFKITAQAGSWSFDDIELIAQVPFPLAVKNAVREGDFVKCTVTNSSLKSVSFTEGSTTGEKNLASKGTIEFSLPIQKNGALELADLKLLVPGFPVVNYPMYFYNPEGQTNWLSRPLSSNRILEISPDAKIARIMQPPNSGKTKPRLLALLAPLVHKNGVLPDFRLDPDSTDHELRFTAPDAKLVLTLRENEIDFHVEPVRSSGIFEGPVLRVPGRLKGGLLCGVEYLGPGDVSSSNIDVREPNNNRSVPPKDWITFPLATVASESLSVGLCWDDMELQPTFSSPNRFDLADDHRVALQGVKIDATIRLVEPAANQDPITEMIRWAVHRRGLPELPAAPRTNGEQTQLCIAALDGPLRGSDKISWGYFAEDDDKIPKEPYADVLSTLYRLKGELPRVAGLVPEGSVLTNDAIYFLTNQVQQWKDLRSEDVQKALDEMRPDGSFIRQSLFPEQDYYQEYEGITVLNSENRDKNSFGYATRKAAFLLDYARITGDRSVLASAEKTLQVLGRESVPRGGFYWETPLHTPDLLSAAYATWAFCRGFELTQKPEYLEKAQQFALSGLPFVYQWGGDETVRRYTTVPMFGASQRERTWFGVAQPWSGVIYGYALTLLAEHDSSTDWKRIANGILIAAEQIQHPDGKYIGCLPDAFALDLQTRLSPNLNPCGLVSLRNAVEGRIGSLSVASDEADTLASPFTIQMNRRGAVIRNAPSGFKFEILINGQQIKPVQGSGNNRDQITF
ncbi:MAG: hypothetical protein FWC43_06760 [Planctomycetaceae bacterium]|nr:hypothetical protein [Planctomycetaceae bacterium]